MLKVQNKKVISRLSKRTLAAKQKKNIVVVIAIMLTAMMFTALFTIAGAMNNSFQEYTMRQVGGKSMAGVKCILPEDYEKISKDSAVKNPSYRIVVGQAENEELLKLPTEINYAEDKNAKDMFCYPTEGTMPRERLEIATSTLVLEALGVPCKVGEKVSLTILIGKKVITEEFTLSGYWEGDVAAMAQECFVSREFCDEVAPTPEISFYKQKDTINYAGYWMMDFNYSNSWDIEEKTISLLERNGYDTMNYGVNWAYTTSSMDTEGIVLIAVILCLILASGYLIIYNIFSLNVVSDIQSYGLLKTIGTTEKQLKKLVRKQVFLLSFIGIPCGLLLGIIVAKCLFPVIVSNFEISGVMKFSIHPLLLVGAALFSFFTVWISSNKPCKLAAKVSPIEAVRYTDTSYAGKKKEKKTKKVTAFSFAWANIGRSPKRVVVVILSLSLSMVLLNSIYSIVSGFDKDKYISQYLIGDAMLTDATVLNSALESNVNGITEEVKKDLKEMEDVEAAHNVYYEYSWINLDDAAYNNITQFIDQNPDYFPEDIMETDVSYLKEKHILDCDVYGLDQWGTNQLEVCKGNIDWEKFKTGKYVLINTFGSARIGDTSLGVYYDVGEKLNLQLPDGTTKEYEVMAITNIPFVMTRRASFFFDTEVVLPETEYLDHAVEKGALHSILSLKDGKTDSAYQTLEAYTENEQKNLSFVTKQTYEKEFGDFVSMFWIVGGALSFVLALIGILNFTNAIITSILARKKELAMMEAVGMTGKQMKGMLAWEGIFYILLTGVCSIGIGSLLSELVLKNVVTDIWFFSYHFTVFPIVVCIPILAVIAGMIPVVAYRNMTKESAVVRMRGNE